MEDGTELPKGVLLRQGLARQIMAPMEDERRSTGMSGTTMASAARRKAETSGTEICGSMKANVGVL